MLQWPGHYMELGFVSHAMAGTLYGVGVRVHLF